MQAFDLPQTLRAQIEREARAAIPRECCGLIEGTRTDNRIVALALHPARNVAVELDRFEIDPAEQFHLLRALRGSGREIVGCYHSHPNGEARPSPSDLHGASEDGFVWLVCGLQARRVGIGAFLFDGGGFRALEMQDLAAA